jgi:hypothetical protein
VGGVLGRLDQPAATRIQALNDLALLSATDGISATFLAGYAGENPTCEGTIGKISLGTDAPLKGTAYVNTPIPGIDTSQFEVITAVP